MSAQDNLHGLNAIIPEDTKTLSHAGTQKPQKHTPLLLEGAPLHRDTMSKFCLPLK